MFTVICYNERGNVEINSVNRIGYERETKRVWFTVEGVRHLFVYENVEKEYASRAMAALLKKDGVDLRAFGKYKQLGPKPTAPAKNENTVGVPLREEPKPERAMAKMAQGVVMSVEDSAKNFQNKMRENSERMRQRNEERAAQRAAEKAEKEAQRAAEKEAKEAAKQVEREAKAREKAEKERAEQERREKEQARKDRQAAMAQREAEMARQRELEEAAMLENIQKAAEASIDADMGYGELPKNDIPVDDMDLETDDILNEIAKLELDMDIEDLDDLLKD